MCRQEAKWHVVGQLTLAPNACMLSMPAGAGQQHKAVRLNLQVPYRVNFGQSLAVIGAGEPLGNWDSNKVVQMKWSDGDWWTTEVTVPTG